MDVVIKIDSENRYSINEDITFEEFDEQGYFFIPTTEKIIVMNETAYFLWQLITQSAKNNVTLTYELIKEYFTKEFTFSEQDTELLKKDIINAVFHFVNEDFLRMV